MKLIMRSVEKRRQPRFGERCSIASQLTKPIPAFGSCTPRISRPSNGSPAAIEARTGRADAPRTVGAARALGCTRTNG